MYGFEIRQLVVIGIDAGAEEQTGISTVDDLGGTAELDEVGLVFLVSRCNKAVDLDSSGHGLRLAPGTMMYFSLQLDLLFVLSYNERMSRYLLSLSTIRCTVRTISQALSCLCVLFSLRPGYS